MISHDVATLEAGNLTSLTTGWVGVVGADVFVTAVAVTVAVVVVVVPVKVRVGVVIVVIVVIDVDTVDFSITGLATVVVTDFGEPGTIGALPVIIIKQFNT